MRSTTLFGLYGATIVLLIVAMGWVTLFNLDRARFWDARIQLAQEGYSLHLELEANIFRLLKQHGDALLIGDRDGGLGERQLKDAINENLAQIRVVIGREIDLVGEGEIEELELLEQIEADIREINSALLDLSASGEALETSEQIENLADLLDREIDVHLTQLIDQALLEEQEEFEEVLAEAAAVRAWNELLVYTLLGFALVLLLIGALFFNHQIRRPLIRLTDSIRNFRRADYGHTPALGGSREFQQLSAILGEMAESLAERQASQAEQQQNLEHMVETRTLELKSLVDRLELGEENRKRLMADISHELRTPLTIILGEAEVALRNTSGLSDETSDTLARIRDSARHTNQIVDDMLTVARQEAGHLRLDRHEADLRAILLDAIEMFPREVAHDMPPEPALAMVDAVRFRQAILALLQNARRYGGPTIRAELQRTATGFRLHVEDDGPGLSEDEKRNAFQRFFRGSNAAEQGIEGSGLGLPVVKSIVEAHGGEVSLEESALGGLRVRLDLPGKPAMRVVRPDGEARRPA